MTEMNTTDLSRYDDRKVAIQVTGLPSQTIKRKSNYTVIVPYNRLSQTIQQICRTGGRIVNITVQSSSLINVQKATILSEVPQTISDPIIESKPVTILEEARIAPEPIEVIPDNETIAETIQSEETIVSPPVEIVTTPSPETRGIDSKIPDRVRRKTPSYRAIHPKRTGKKAQKVRGKKARRRSKTYSLN